MNCSSMPGNMTMSAVERIVLQKSKIERRRKSRKISFLVGSATATLRSAYTKLRGRFCVKRCGPSYRRVRNASAVLKNFGRHPKKSFATLSLKKRTILAPFRRRRHDYFLPKTCSTACITGSLKFCSRWQKLSSLTDFSSRALESITGLPCLPA